MGAWDAGIFDNDFACDWAFSLEESNDLSLVEETLEKVLAVGSEYLDSSEAEEALAAAETVARLQGKFGAKNAYTEPVDQWVSKNKMNVPPELVQKTLAAIDRIMAPSSELLELWEDTEKFDEWKNNVNDLKSRVHPS